MDRISNSVFVFFNAIVRVLSLSFFKKSKRNKVITMNKNRIRFGALVFFFVAIYVIFFRPATTKDFIGVWKYTSSNVLIFMENGEVVFEGDWGGSAVLHIKYDNKQLLDHVVAKGRYEPPDDKGRINPTWEYVSVNSGEFVPVKKSEREYDPFWNSSSLRLNRRFPRNWLFIDDGIYFVKETSKTPDSPPKKLKTPRPQALRNPQPTRLTTTPGAPRGTTRSSPRSPNPPISPRLTIR